MLSPSLSAAKEQARLAACAGQMRCVGVGLRQYATSYRNRHPPFAFSDHVGNLPLSGHWGGPSQAGDPGCFGRRGVEDVNLWRLAAGRIVAPRQMICPGADRSAAGGADSYFPHTCKFSTYCLRMLYSEEIFRDVPELVQWSGRGLLGVYTAAGSGTRFYVGGELLMVPYLRTDVRYREADPAGGQPRSVDLTQAAVMSDAFWYRRHHAPAPPPAKPGMTAYPVRAGWCHGQRFNVLYGDGSVRAVRDDGTLAANSVAAGGQPAPDGTYFASHAIRAWRYFEDGR